MPVLFWAAVLRLSASWRTNGSRSSTSAGLNWAMIFSSLSARARWYWVSVSSGPGSGAMHLRVNGQPYTIQAPPSRTLLEAIRVDLGLGRGEATAWTCDLTKAYVEINGDYRS